MQASSPQDAQVPSEDEDDRPFLVVPTENRFEWLNEDFSTRSAKQRVEREELERQQAAVLDALEFDLTMGDSDSGGNCSSCFPACCCSTTKRRVGPPREVDRTSEQVQSGGVEFSR